MSKAEAQNILFEKIREADESFKNEPHMTIEELRQELGV
jgi:hypothetical protein